MAGPRLLRSSRVRPEKVVQKIHTTIAEKAAKIHFLEGCRAGSVREVWVCDCKHSEEAHFMLLFTMAFMRGSWFWFFVSILRILFIS